MHSFYIPFCAYSQSICPPKIDTTLINNMQILRYNSDFRWYKNRLCTDIYIKCQNTCLRYQYLATQSQYINIHISINGYTSSQEYTS